MRRRFPSPAIAFFVAVGSGLAAWSGIELAGGIGHLGSIWIANAVLVFALLSSARSQWRVLIGATLATHVAVNLVVGGSLVVSIGLAIANVTEATLAALLLHDRLRSAADLIEQKTQLRFFAFVVVLAPAVSALIGALTLHLVQGASFPEAVLRWWAAAALGMALIVPLLLASRPAALGASLRSRLVSDWIGSFGVLLIVAIFVFNQASYPILFLLLPPVLLIAFRIGVVGTAIGISLCAVVALVLTTSNVGPFTLIQDDSSVGQTMVMQLLLATLILTTYPVCAITATQRKLLREIAASEERFKLLAANSSDVVALTDPDGIIRYVSPAVTALLGWEAEDLIGKSGKSFIHIDDAMVYVRGVEMLTQGRDTLTGSFRMRHRDGRYLWMETVSRGLFDTTGKHLGWVSSSRDISARRRVEQIKNEFIATVSHELRTPLTAMLGAVNLAASGKFTQPSTEFTKLLHLAKANGDRLEALVGDILDFEKVSARNMLFDLAPHAVDDLIDQALVSIQPYAAQLSVRVLRRRSVPTVAINVDAGRFQQIMANLLSNAAKFSHENGIVEVDTVVVERHCRISIIDRGCGIPQEFRSNMFERFVHADASDRRKRSGPGLGMTIAKHMTEQMGGNISFESEESVGTTFHVEFPLAATDVQAGDSQ